MLAAHPDDEKRMFAASRRQLIFGAALTAGLAGTAGLIPGAASAAQAKLSPADSGYQARPNGGQRCELCANWQAPGSCKVVSGPISPSGWCSLFAAHKS